MSDEQRHVVEVKQLHMGAELLLRVWSNDSAVEEVLGKEDCYRIDRLVDNQFGIPCKAAVIDFGANIGAFTIAMLMRGCTVLSVEADWQTHNLMIGNVFENMDLYHGYDRFFPINAMVGGQEPLYSFSWKGPRSYVPPLKADARLWDVFPVDHPRILKVDIEGWEQQLFDDAGAVGLLAMAQLVLMEWHCYDGERYKACLERLGFRVQLTGCGNPAPKYDPSFARGMLYGVK